jgi:hypothetical protein
MIIILVWAYTLNCSELTQGVIKLPFSNNSLETAELNTLSKTAYDRAKKLLSAWGIDGTTEHATVKAKKRHTVEAAPSALKRSSKK